MYVLLLLIDTMEMELPFRIELKPIDYQSIGRTLHTVEASKSGDRGIHLHPDTCACFLGSLYHKLLVVWPRGCPVQFRHWLIAVPSVWFGHRESNPAIQFGRLMC